MFINLTLTIYYNVINIFYLHYRRSRYYINKPTHGPWPGLYRRLLLCRTITILLVITNDLINTIL